MSSFSNSAWLRTYKYFDGFTWRKILLAVYAVWCVPRAGCVYMPVCAHKETRVGLWLSCLVPIHVIASKQGASLNWNFPGVYRQLQTCLAFCVSAGDLNSGAHDCRASTLTL